MTDYCSGGKYNSVPDPYYGGAAGFELVLDILEDACEGGLIRKLQEGIKMVSAQSQFNQWSKNWRISCH